MLCDRLFAVLAIHIYQEVFSALPLGIFSSFSLLSTTGWLFTFFRFLHLAPGFLQQFLLQFLGLCHVSHSSILSLCICYLTTNNFMLTLCTYEIGDTIFIQFIFIFVLLYFSNFLLCSIKILQVSSSSIFANPSGKALLQSQIRRV